MFAISCRHREPDDADRRVGDRSGGDDLIRLRHGDRHNSQFPFTQRSICMRPLIASVLVPNDRSAGALASRWTVGERLNEGRGHHEEVGQMRAEGLLSVILPKDRDPRFVTIRRGGALTDSDHRLLALWAASCAEHVLDRFESARPEDPGL